MVAKKQKHVPSYPNGTIVTVNPELLKKGCAVDALEDDVLILSGCRAPGTTTSGEEEFSISTSCGIRVGIANISAIRKV